MMTSTNMNDYITKSSSTPWAKLTEEAVNTDGILVKVMRYDEKQQRPTTFLLRFEPGASYPYHNHPAGEELLVLEGSCILEETVLQAGDYLYTPAGFRHSVRSETGCTLLLIVPEEVEIIG